MTVGVITDPNTLADLRSRIAEADEGIGVPLETAYQRWRENALARETAPAAEMVSAVNRFLGAAAVAFAAAAVMYRLSKTEHSDRESAQGFVDLGKEPPATEETPGSHVR